MARKKKERSIFDSPKRKSSGGKGIFGSIVGGSGKGKKEKSIFGSIMGEGKGKKGGGSIFGSIMGEKKGRKKSKSIFSNIMGGGDGFGGALGGFFGGIFGSTTVRMAPDYDGMRTYMAAHDLSPSNRNDVLYYIMRFDGEADVKRILTQTAGHNFGSVQRGNWAYQQWSKYWSDPVFRDIIGTMAHEDANAQTAWAFVENYWGSRKVPKGVQQFMLSVYFDRFGIHKAKIFPDEKDYEGYYD